MEVDGGLRLCSCGRARCKKRGLAPPYRLPRLAVVATGLPLVIHFDLRLPNLVRYSLGPLVGILLKNDLLRHSRLLIDDCFFALSLSFDGALTERVLGPRQRTIDRTAFDGDSLLAQSYLLLYGLLDHVAADAHATLVDLTLTYLQVLFDYWDGLIASRRAGRTALPVPSFASLLPTRPAF